MSDERLGPYLLGPNDDENRGIYTGDARELSGAIPDESVDLIFTDPVYQNIDDYLWLARTAARVLKPKGIVLTWSNGKWHRINTNWLEGFGLIYRYTFTCHMIRAIAPLNGRIISKCNRVIWFDRYGTSKLTDYIADGYPDRNDPSLGNHRWAKSPRYTLYLMEAFPWEVVFDPFCGGGTVPVVCKQLGTGRRYLAFEIEPETADLARDRVCKTQPPLFIMDSHEQVELVMQ